jgi:hypothetical protein
VADDVDSLKPNHTVASVFIVEVVSISGTVRNHGFTNRKEAVDFMLSLYDRMNAGPRVTIGLTVGMDVVSGSGVDIKPEVVAGLRVESVESFRLLSNEEAMYSLALGKKQRREALDGF